MILADTTVTVAYERRRSAQLQQIILANGAAVCGSTVAEMLMEVRSPSDEGLPEGWVQAELGVFIDSMANGIYKPDSFYADDGVPCLRMYNIQDGCIVWYNLKRMTLTRGEIEQYRLLPGDILVNRVNSR